MKEEKDAGGQTIPYLSYLASKDVKRGGKRRRAIDKLNSKNG